MDGSGGGMQADAVRAQARERLDAGDYVGARATLEPLIDAEDDALALELSATACHALGEIAPAMAALERAYRLHVSAERHGDAGRCACYLADLELTHLGTAAVASGWLGRARRHLDLEPRHPAHVQLEALSAYLAMAYEKDPGQARDFAVAGLDHARRNGDRRGEIVGLAYLGYVEVALGRLDDGFRLLDEATAAALAGEVPPAEGLDTYCVLITACERVRDFDRVDQWARRVVDLSAQVNSDVFAPYGRTAYAHALIWQGRWDEADTELDKVLSDAEGKPASAAVAMVLRSSLRRRQGRLQEAAAELEPAEREPYRRTVRHLVLAARARLELDLDDPQAAADIAERYLRAVSPTDLIERVDALETLVRARLELDDVDRAEGGATELARIAERIPTDGVRAAALAAAARVVHARGHTDEARDLYDRAIAHYEAAGLEHDAAETRVSLARLEVEAGRLDAARRAATAAMRIARTIGAARESAAAEALLATLRDGPPATGPFTTRELEVLRLVADGLANAEIAERLVLSIRTIERHLSNIYLKVGATGPAARTLAVAQARRDGLLDPA